MVKRLWSRYWHWVVGILMGLLLAAGPAIPALGHSESELEVWLETLGTLELPELALADQEFLDLGRVQEIQFAEMRGRHPCSRVLETWTDAVCKPKPKPVAKKTGRAPAQVSSGPVASSGWPAAVERWRGLVSSYFGGETELALCVISWETKQTGDPTIVGPTNDHGLFQIHVPLWTDHFGIPVSALYDPVTNTSIAKKIRDSMGWGAWSAVKRGICG